MRGDGVARLLEPATSTSVGSLPHHDPVGAANFVLTRQPHLPAAPQLPLRTPAEGMVAQVLVGFPGIGSGSAGEVSVDPATFDAEADVPGRLDPEAWSGLLAFAAAISGRTGPVKVQLAGPLTVGVGLHRAGLTRRTALTLAARAVAARAAAILDVIRTHAPAAPVVAFLDEPALSTGALGVLGLAPDAAADVLSSALAGLGSTANGIHCCGSTDWSVLTMAGPDVISLPVALAADAAPVLASFLEGGGWVAWGVVPTDGPVGEDAERWWRALVQAWCGVIDHGGDPGRLRCQALVTPACGLAGHGFSQADRALRLTGLISERVRNQAVASRLAIGA